MRSCKSVTVVSVRAIIAICVWALALPCLADRGYRYGYPYGGFYGNAGIYHGPYNADYYLELVRIRRELRDQRRIDRHRTRRHEQELDRLRRQSMASHQVSAEQACYYRSTGGFELCADLYASGSDEFSACEALVAERNPSCNGVPLLGRGDE